MIKAYLMLKGGMFPIQIRKRTLKYLRRAMYNDFRLRVRFWRWLRHLFYRKPKLAKTPAKKQGKSKNPMKDYVAPVGQDGKPIRKTR